MYNSVFIHIPKTAGTYITVALNIESLALPRQRGDFKQTGNVTFGHQDYAKLVGMGIISKEFDNNSFKYTFCRNPFDRAVSHFFYAKRRHPEILNRKTSFLEFTKNLHLYKRYPKQVGRFGGVLAFRPQCECITGVNIDFIGHLETLREDLEKISKIIGTGIKDVPVKNRNVTEHAHYSHYYDQESEENIKNFYAVDFERFGYDNRLLSIF